MWNFVRLMLWQRCDDDSHTIFPHSYLCLFIRLIFIRWITPPTEPSLEARFTTTAPSRRSWLAWPCCSTSLRSDSHLTRFPASFVSSADRKSSRRCHIRQASHFLFDLRKFVKRFPMHRMKIRADVFCFVPYPVDGLHDQWKHGQWGQRIPDRSSH